MLASRLTTVPLTAFVTSFGKSSVRSIKPVLQFQNVGRIQQNSTRAGRFARRMNAREQAADAQASVKSRVMAPGGQGAFTIGKGMLAGVSTVGLGALCFYGLGLSNESGTIEHAALWPDYIKKRVRDTYMYFGAGIGVTAGTAVAAFRNARLMNLMAQNSLLSIGLTFAAMIGTSILCQSIPYEKGFGAKQMAWLLHAGVLGAVVAPVTMLGGPILIRAAWYTAGVVGGLSALAMCAPSEKFLNMGAPLAIGFGVVLASSIGSAFLPPTTALGASLMSISMYGGLVLFSLFLLYDTQKIMKKAETHPPYAAKPFDPINASLGIYADTLNIFIRIAFMLAGGGGKRK